LKALLLWLWPHLAFPSVQSGDYSIMLSQS